MLTDAVFNQDIRMIRQVIARIDGNAPKDTDVGRYSTLFGDCLAELLEMDDADRLRVTPQDTVMMALCKSLFDIAAEDIYGKARARGKRRPSTDVKNDRDAAVQLILERVGGRKTATPVDSECIEYGEADWLERALPDS